jgi:hypothetical protein
LGETVPWFLGWGGIESLDNDRVRLSLLILRVECGWTGGWVGPRARLDIEGTDKSHAPAKNQMNPNTQAIKAAAHHYMLCIKICHVYHLQCNPKITITMVQKWDQKLLITTECNVNSKIKTVHIYNPLHKASSCWSFQRW